MPKKQFLNCGELDNTNGTGFDLPDSLKLKNNVYRGDLTVTKKMVKYGMLNIPRGLEKVTGDFDCSNLKLKSLEGCPLIVEGDFYCDNNKLESLLGSPITVGGHFDCNSNKLISLKGCPKEVGYNFDCSNNKLTSLEGCPTILPDGDFDCSGNLLKSLEGCPKEVVGSFSCADNSIEFNEEDVRKVCKVGDWIYI